MPKKTIYKKDGREICVLDEKGSGGAHHRYMVYMTQPNATSFRARTVTTVEFQEGPVKEAGVNGCQNEDLLRIVIDRLEGFQAGEFECLENAGALRNLRDALECLESRTKNREMRGVEGRNMR